MFYIKESKAKKKKKEKKKRVSIVSVLVVVVVHLPPPPPTLFEFPIPPYPSPSHIDHLSASPLPPPPPRPYRSLPGPDRGEYVQLAPAPAHLLLAAVGAVALGGLGAAGLDGDAVVALLRLVGLPPPPAVQLAAVLVRLLVGPLRWRLRVGRPSGFVV
ncbi:hypothetical protein VTK26DRAFT_1879 [Humicola hyalothermophila]